MASYLETETAINCAKGHFFAIKYFPQISITHSRDRTWKWPWDWWKIRLSRPSSDGNSEILMRESPRTHPVPVTLPPREVALCMLNSKHQVRSGA